MNKVDWFTELKMKIVLLCLDSEKYDKMMQNMLANNLWITDDINLYESYTEFGEITRLNRETLNKLIDYVIDIEENKKNFLKEDLSDEYDIVEDSYSLEQSFLLNMVRYVIIATDFINQHNYEEAIESYFNFDIFCYNQIKTNYNIIKELTKERR